jgi:hypothetical protein
MTNIIHPKLDHEMVEDFEEDDEDDPIAALPFKTSMVIVSENPQKNFRNVKLTVKVRVLCS